MAAERDEIRALWVALKPDGYGDRRDSEPWDHYWPRVRPLLPNFPEVAVQQWLWRHYCFDFSWLRLRALRFTEQRWSVERILQQFSGWPDHGLIEHWSDYMQTNPDAQSDWLVTYMRNKGTWPQPPMVIANNIGLRRPDGLKLSAPYQLMEGHHRLGYFHALARLPDALRPEHELLIVDVPEAAVLDYWPLNTGA